MYRLRNFMNCIILKDLYYSLIYSHIMYAIHVWGSPCDTELHKILLLQKKAVRMMTRNDYFVHGRWNRVHSNPLFKELGILKVQDVFKFSLSIFILCCLELRSPSIFHNWFIKNHTVHRYNTTSNTNIVMRNYFEIENVELTNILHTRSANLVNYGAKTLKVSGPIIWNSLPENIRVKQSVLSFKMLLKKHILLGYR